MYTGWYAKKEIHKMRRVSLSLSLALSLSLSLSLSLTLPLYVSHSLCAPTLNVCQRNCSASPPPPPPLMLLLLLLLET